MRNLQEQVEKAFCVPKIVLTFYCLNELFLVISKCLQILGLQPRFSKVFLDHHNNFFSHKFRTILVTKYH